MGVKPFIGTVTTRATVRKNEEIAVGMRTYRQEIYLSKKETFVSLGTPGAASMGGATRVPSAQTPVIWVII